MTAKKSPYTRSITSILAGDMFRIGSDNSPLLVLLGKEITPGTDIKIIYRQHGQNKTQTTYVNTSDVLFGYGPAAKHLTV